MTLPQRFDVTFKPPAMASQHVPVPIAGAGELHVTEQGIEVRGFKANSGLRNGLMVLGFFGGFALIIILGMALRLGDGGLEVLMGVGMVVGGIASAAVNAIPFKEEQPVQHAYGWDKVAKVMWDGSAKALLIVVKKAKPRGGIYIDLPLNSPIEQLMTREWQARK